MRKHKFIDLFLILVILAISFWNVTQQQEKVSLKESVAGFCCKVFQKIYFSVKLRKKTERTE
ncbi:Uncharacterised protein [Enterococcus malodoratus]|nr:Uncharacterised protein [Enterococcus malodoratus]